MIASVSYCTPSRVFQNPFYAFLLDSFWLSELTYPLPHVQAISTTPSFGGTSHLPTSREENSPRADHSKRPSFVTLVRLKNSRSSSIRRPLPFKVADGAGSCVALPYSVDVR